MAELTKQQSIKLLTPNKFRISAASTARSRNFTNRSVDVSQINCQNKNQKTLPKYPQSQNFKKALLKIGALPKQDIRFSFVPQEEDHLTFRARRLQSLRQKYFPDKCEEDQSEPYNNEEEIDEAALGCWNYGQKSSRKRVWRRYKENLNRLNFDVLKSIGKKKVY